MSPPPSPDLRLCYLVFEDPAGNAGAREAS